MDYQIESDDAAETELLAQKIGARVKGGETIELVSDLGGGKTTFVRGLALGMGSQDRVASPTFMISKVYQAGERELHHFDFYRLQEAGIVSHELEEVAGDPHVVTVVEWGNVVQDVLPTDRLTITIKRTGEQSRSLLFEYPTRLAYLIQDLH